MVELLVGALLLALAVAGTLTIFSSGVRQSSEARRTNELQAAVDENVAEVQRLNDRYSCSTLPCAPLNVEPSEIQYSPTPIAYVDDATFAASDYGQFRTLCDNGTLTANLITAINGLPQNGFVRTAQAEAAVTGTSSTVLQPHRYVVTWTDGAGGPELRRLIFTPTVARWCPSDPTP